MTKQINLAFTYAKGIKPELLTLMEMARGVVSGMLADHFQGRHQDSFESSLRPHILATAQKRGWAVSLEYKLPRDSASRGSNKKIDYILQYGRQALAVECKTFRPKVQAGIDISNDLEKLSRFSCLTRNEIRTSSWELITWDSFAEYKIGRGKPGFIIKQVRAAFPGRKLKVVSESDIDAAHGRSVERNQAVVIEGSVGTYKAFCIVVCVEPPLIKSNM